MQTIPEHAMMDLHEMPGRPVEDILSQPPCASWAVERSERNRGGDSVVVDAFEGRGVEILCDPDGVVRTVFVSADADSAFLGRWRDHTTRDDVRAILGAPDRSAEEHTHPVFGTMGAWDLFLDARVGLNVAYAVGGGAVEKLTMMRCDVVP